MKTALDNTVEMIDKMSRNNRWDNPIEAAKHLKRMWFARAAVSREACQRLLDDQNWSQDREPYVWLTEVRDAI